MKINTDYEVLHQAIDKFKKDEKLDEAEKNSLLELIKASERDYYPSKAELTLQKINIELLENKDICFDLWSNIMENCGEFERKYC